MQASRITAFDRIYEHLELRFGPRLSPPPYLPIDRKVKAFGWELANTAFCILRGAKGTVVLPWDPITHGRCYLVSHIDPPRANRMGRSTEIVRRSPKLGWLTCVAYLDIWTEHDLAQTTTLIELKEAMQPIPEIEAPNFDSPSIDGRPTPLSFVHRLVWFRDKGQCVKCASTTNLQFDHVIPRVRGTSTCGNLCVLCATCNRRKSNRI